VLHRERYDAAAADAHLAAHDERLSVYDARFSLTETWSTRVLARPHGPPDSMAGRHVLRAAPERRGLPSR
jgi:hypothetical protein